MTEVVTQPDVLGSLGINGKLFISQLINVGIVLFVVWRWVYRPLLKIMDARSQKISEGLENATNAKQWVADAMEKKNEILHSALQEVEQMMKDAHARAEQKRQEVLRETQIDLERQLQDARARLMQEKEAMIHMVKNEVVDLIAAATARVAQDTLDVKGQKDSIERALQVLDKEV